MNLSNNINIGFALFGGIVIGLSATLLLLANGRIAGISGIAGRLLAGPTEQSWRFLFVLGLPLGAGLWWIITGQLEIQMQSNLVELIIGAVLVGVGTRLGAGCTSGHGVCGIGRRSLRSVTATVVFMAVAVLTVFIKGGVNHETVNRCDYRRVVVWLWFSRLRDDQPSSGAGVLRYQQDLGSKLDVCDGGRACGHPTELLAYTETT